MKNSIINIKNNKLLVIIAISILILLISSIARHELFNSGGDLAFFDQCVYLISQGKNPISSVLGFHALADHAAWILYPIALLYKIYPTVYWLFLVQSLSLSLGAIPAYFLSINAGLKESQAILIVVIYLLYPLIYNANLLEFHPDTIAVPALFMAILAARKQKIVWFCASVIVILGCKAVLSLTVAAMGVGLLLFEKRQLYGIVAIATGIAWFLIANKIIIPFFGHDAALINRHLYRYSYLGNSFFETLKIILLQPKLIFSNIFSLINLEYLFYLFVPVIWGLRPKYMIYMIAAIPCLALNLLADHPSQKNLIWHYSLPIIPFLTLSLIAYVATHQNFIKHKKAIILWSLFWFFALGKFGFFAGKYLKNLDNLQATKEAISLVKTQNSVLTTDIIVPHLTHRELISFKYNINELNNFHYILINVRNPGLVASKADYNNLVNQLKTNSELKLKFQKDDVYLFEKR
ncbi:DUF2079 domain-containing protein [Dolichospermum planctonicum CS-1226]|uniref:DUF2079 domain-containing protein n=1 Tax=Dolichospermum planctonicum CS-1226 TaxID=3021751 RepID=A0ABT5AHE7_9CYAN|nr:DUF2079 domain-containing protein [Dolichospermum planctonicum]MDB9535926.1 DUF2079 domain-containing protein [Dolichospermum planctonicum CS-1226]